MTIPPSVCRMVHYVARGSLDGVYPPVCRAAVITEAGAWVDIEISDLVARNTNTTTPGPDGSPLPLYRSERVVHQHWDDDAVYLHVFNPRGTFVDGPQRRDDGTVDLTTPRELLGPDGEPATLVGPEGLCTGLLHAPGTWHYPAYVPGRTDPPE